MSEANPWRSILSDALDKAVQARSQPVPGSRLASRVKLAAKQQGLPWPPESGLSFTEFLRGFPDVAEVILRPGQDLLVIPAGRSDLLVSDAVTPTSRRLIRKDLFDALTQVRDTVAPYYVKNLDRVIWRPAGDAPTDAVPMPRATWAGEAEMRRDFIVNVTSPDAKQELTEAIDSEHPLRNFTTRANALGLRDQWNGYRAERILERLQKWASSTETPWQESWISGSSPLAVSARPSPMATSIRRGARLADAIASLPPEDLARIQIPLDLVARLLGE